MDDLVFLRALGLVIKTRRKVMGITQTQMSNITLLGQATVSRIENGEHASSVITLQRISVCLGVELSLLIKNAEDFVHSLD